jgi:predicted phosphodiesterase
MRLQEHFDFFCKILKPIPLPAKCLVISDLHAGAGDDHDPLKGSGMEKAVLDLLQFSVGYTLLTSEVYDLWRGFTYSACAKAHLHLDQLICAYEEAGRLYRALGNHERDVLDLPEAIIFEGFGKKIFFDHGYFEDPPNDALWKIGRWCVRAADELGIDPETSPHPSSPDRHEAVVLMRDELARNNPNWTFFYGHTHDYRHNKIDNECPINSFNSGSPITGKLTYYTLEEGEIKEGGKHGSQ